MLYNYKAHNSSTLLETTCISHLTIKTLHPQPEWSTRIGRGCRDRALIGREDHSVTTPALLCHKEPARASKAPY